MTNICPICGAPNGKGLPNIAPDPVVEPDVLVPPPGVAEVIVDDLLPVAEPEPLPEPEPEPEPDFDTDEIPDFSGLKLNELRAIAKELEIKLPFGASKADIIELITAPRG